MRTLEEIRARIDEIDAQLLPLFLDRLECSREVAEVKIAKGLPVLNAAREKQILDEVERKAGSRGGEARLLYDAILTSSRALQHRMMDGGRDLRDLIENAPSKDLPHDRIACQGVPGAYSHEAALLLYPGCRPHFYKTWEDIFRAIRDGKEDLGILPVENSSAGSVSDVYGLILKYRFSIVGAATLRIRHCLAVPEGIDLSQVKKVYSHPQGLAQCSEYTEAHGLTPVPCSNTAAAAKAVAEGGEPAAAICSEQAAKEYGLHIAAHGIQNSSANRTRFVAISRTLFIPEDAQKISLCFSLPHTTGSLNGVLSQFAAAGLNLTKIESRPISSADGENFEYDFYLDFAGNIRSGDTLNLIASLQSELPRFSFLGNYTELD